ncbi:MFS transporter [Sinorhizobium medicae]|uniref:MFS transporter n=1 Tax=Sinorhizobium medicae TaxID=110321 RepID=UPI003B517992
MTGAATEHTGLFVLLENRTIRSIFLGSQLSSLGWLMQTVALGCLMATVSSSDVMVASFRLRRPCQRSFWRSSFEP